MSWSRQHAVVLVVAASTLAVAACTSSSATGAASSSPQPSARASRPAELAEAHAVYVVVDHSSSAWQSYPRLYSARLLDGTGGPLLPEGVVTDRVEASSDGSVIVYDATPAVRRGSSEAGGPTTWWWSDSTQTHAMTTMPADVLSLAVAADGRSVVVVAGGARSGAVPSVARIDLVSGRSAPVCQGCVPAQKPGFDAHVALALSDDGALLATSTWATDQSSGFVGSRHSTPTTEQVLSLPGGSSRWSSGTAFCTPVTIAGDGTLVRGCAKDEAHPVTLNEVTGVLGPAAASRPTGLPGYESGPLAGGWWYASGSGDASGPLTISRTTALTAASSTVIGRWPGGQQIEALRLAEVTRVAWSGPVPTAS